jgi:hypothetical protein
VAGWLSSNITRRPTNDHLKEERGHDGSKRSVLKDLKVMGSILKADRVELPAPGIKHLGFDFNGRSKY